MAARALRALADASSAASFITVWQSAHADGKEGMVGSAYPHIRRPQKRVTSVVSENRGPSSPGQPCRTPLLARSANRSREAVHIREHLYQTLVEPQIPDTANDDAVLDEEGPVARHTGHDLLVRVHFADVPEARDQQSPAR